MARYFALGTLVARCKQRADMVNSTYVSDDEWKGYISTAYAHLYSLLAETGLRYFEKVLAFDSADLTDNGDNGGRIALPGDFLSVIGVDGEASGVRYELDELMVAQRNAYANSGTGGPAEAFVLAGSDLIVYPKPTEGDYELGYIPQPRDLSAEGDSYSVDVVTPDGEDFIIWSASVYARAKEESDTTIHERNRDRAEARVREWATRRLLHNMRRRDVRSIDADREWWGGDPNDPANYRY